MQAIRLDATFDRSGYLCQEKAAYQAHLKQHPEMESFMLSSDCAFIRVIAQSYQIVKGVDDISWITTDELDSAL